MLGIQIFLVKYLGSQQMQIELVIQLLILEHYLKMQLGQQLV